MTTNWENLAKNALDSQNIQQAIAENIDIHNDDPNAHLGADQALQSHRAAEIIDHLAESVVNDKLSRTARRFMAIVDPSSESDFATLEGAITFCAQNGYGDIFVTAGTHYISSSVSLDARISIYGAGIRETIICSDTEDGSTITLTDQYQAGAEYFSGQIISGVTFGAQYAPIAIYNSDRGATIEFINADFRYTTDILDFSWNSPKLRKSFERCIFNATTSTASLSARYCDFYQCTFDVTGLPNPMISGYHCSFYNCTLNQSSLAGTYSFFGQMDGSVRIKDCSILGCKFDTSVFTDATATGVKLFEGNHFQAFQSARVRISGRNHRFINNRCEHVAGYSPLVVTGSVNCVAIGNLSTQAISDSGTSTYLAGNTLI